MASQKLTTRSLLAPLLSFLLLLGATILTKDLAASTDGLVHQILQFAMYTFHSVLWLNGAFLLNRLLKLYFWDGVVANLVGGSTPRLVKDVAGFFVYLLAITGIVGLVFGKSVTGIWATSGAIGLIIGFALRSIILDVFTGLAVNIDRPYRIGDWIMVHGRRPEMNIIGQLMEINWRTTRIATKDGNVLVVPNSIMGQSMITNFMVPESQNRHEIFFTLDFSVPPDKALRILTAGTMAACGQGPKSPLESPPPKVRIIRTTALGVEYRVRYWLLPANVSPGKGRHLVTKSILEHLQQAGITLAYPKQDIYHDQMPTRHLDANSMDDRKRLLARIELFAQLTDDGLSLLAERMEQRLIDPGECLIKRNEEGDSMFIIVEGLLEVLSDIKGDGNEVRVARLVPGDFFGEMSLLTGEPRSATIRTATESLVYEITKAHMNDLLTKRPRLLEALSNTIAERNARDLARMEPAEIEKIEEQASNLVDKMKAFFGGVFR